MPAIWVAVCVLIPTGMYGQGLDQPEERTYRFNVLSWKSTIRDIHFRDGDGEEFSLFVPNGSPSKVFEYRGIGPIVFYRYDGVDDMGEPIERPVAVYRPATAAPRLLLFVPDTTNRAERYRLLPIDYDPDSIPDGSYRFLNLAQAPIFVKFGSDTFQVDPRGAYTEQSDPVASKGVDVAIAMQQSDSSQDVKVVYSSSWTLKAGRSAFVFVTNEQGMPGNVDVKRVYF